MLNNTHKRVAFYGYINIDIGAKKVVRMCWLWTIHRYSFLCPCRLAERQMSFITIVKVGLVVIKFYTCFYYKITKYYCKICPIYIHKLPILLRYKLYTKTKFFSCHKFSKKYSLSPVILVLLYVSKHPLACREKHYPMKQTRMPNDSFT